MTYCIGLCYYDKHGSDDPNTGFVNERFPKNLPVDIKQRRKHSTINNGNKNDEFAHGSGS